jgi:hypothetical protein
MAKRSNSFVAQTLARALFAACTVALLACGAHRSQACPFCTAIGPTLGQLRGQASVTALAEVEAQPTADRSTLRLHRVLTGAGRLEGKKTLDVALDVAAKPGRLLLIFGSGPESAAAGELAWHAVVVNETSYAYFARSPSLKTAASQRLRYFAPFLEHADALIAQDAYLEFGHAPFDEVARVAEILPLARMRGWLTDPKIPPDRKGFYGLALGIGGDAPLRRANAEFLQGLILAPEDDFRAGFDGILGGYLLLSGAKGLDLIEARYLANPRAADGDVRHALTAVRFYHEYGSDISAARLQSAVGGLLNRPEFAEAAITDLARWKDWSSVQAISGLYMQHAYVQPAIRRAIVGYLLACPVPAAAAALARLRETDPQGVAAAEQTLSRTATVRPSDP